MRYFNDYIRSPAQTQDSIRKSLNRVDITKKDEEKQYVFGWAKIAVDENGKQLVDRQNDLIDPEELEQTAYTYVEFYREAGEMHERGGAGVLIESIIFTKEKMRKVRCQRAGGLDSISQTMKYGQRSKTELIRCSVLRAKRNVLKSRRKNDGQIYRCKIDSGRTRKKSSHKGDHRIQGCIPGWVRIMVSERCF